jgi:DNA-binding response OmpR family regulator
LGNLFTMKILVVEDEPDLLFEIKNFLEKENFVCETAGNFNQADEKLEIYHYDIALIDITIPGGNGLQLVENLKKHNTDTGIIIISARNSLDDKLIGLELGADDYLTKPFHLSELNARVKALLRRRKFEGATSITFNEIKLDPDQGTIEINNQGVRLTKKEFEMLLFFISNKNRLLTRESIAEHLWGDNIDLSDNFDFIYTHINNLRKKIINAGGNDYIKTVYGLGYKFSDK